MKYCLFIGICIFSISGLALETTQKPPKNLELLKCNSIKQGTLWASLMSVVSDDVRTYYAIELAHFDSLRNPYSIVHNIISAKSGSVIRVGSGSFAIEFPSLFGGVAQSNVITLVHASFDTTSDYMGNWKVVKEDGTETHDSVGCTIL